MQTVRTVLGDKQRVGWCQCHEHLYLEEGAGSQMHGALLMQDYDKSLNEILTYKKDGGCAFVDAQPVDSGRMAEWLLDASKTSGVDIIAGTGFHKQCFYNQDDYIFNSNEQQITDLYIAEIQNGMTSSKRDGKKLLSAKAGIIKVAVDKGGIRADAVYEKLFNAAIFASKETGAPILAHFENDEDVFELLNFMTNHGLAPQRLIACHLDRARKNETDYHIDVANAGVYLEFDSINRLKYISHEDELATIKSVVTAGYADKLLLSLDTTNERLSNYGAPMSLSYILTEFRPMLESVGIDEHTLQRIMADNATAALSFFK